VETKDEGNVTSAFGGSDGDPPDWPVIVPLGIRIAQAQGPRPTDTVPTSMSIVLDVDNIPGLPEALDRHLAGEVFDTETRWWVSHPPQSKSPIAILSVYLQQPDLGLHIAIDVDEYSNALKIVARTKRVAIVDPEMDHNLRIKNPFEVLNSKDSGRSMVISVEDAQPVLQILLQRLDISPQGLAAEATPTDTSEDEGQSVEEFLSGARKATLTTLVMIAGEAPAIVLVDPGVRSLGDRLSFGPDFTEGRWKVKHDDDALILRLDCGPEDDCIASWFLVDPPQELLRAAGCGANLVVVVDRPIRPGSNRKVLAQMNKGTSIYVEKATFALFELMENSPPETDAQRGAPEPPEDGEDETGSEATTRS